MFLFHSKAQTLKYLYEKGFPTPKPYLIQYFNWLENKQVVIKEVADLFQDKTLAVRSSKLGEDSEDSSQAGAFDSLLNVLNEEDEFTQAVNDVFSSYGMIEGQDEVLVQSMISSVEISGVVMTKSPEDGAPYYVINYDDETGKTDTVTGGKTSKTVFVYRDCSDSNFDSSRIKSIVHLVKKLEVFINRDDLDIEFAQDLDNQIYLLQVRPITTSHSWNLKIQEKVERYLPGVSDLVNVFQKRHPSLLGDFTLFGVMPDWNPAEIIGLHPRLLDISLYRYLITKKTWAEARQELGYYKFNPTELMIVLAGRPYIDVRSSFNSFLPEELPEELGEKIINLWLNRLKLHPEFHDKVEFEIASTVWNFDLNKTLLDRYSDDLIFDEINLFCQVSFVQANKMVRCHDDSSLNKAINQLRKLEIKQNKFECLTNPYAILAQTKRVLDECENLGTKPFSVVARHAFIAEDWLRSLVREGVLEQSRIDILRSSIRTVSSEMSHDFYLLKKKEMKTSKFYKKYGHLRPGTYDIRSPRYDQRKDLLKNSINFKSESQANFIWTADETIKLNKLFKRHHLEINADEFLTYVKLSIEWREKGKFIFTRSLSFVLEELCRWGECVGLTRDDMSWLNIEELFTLLAQPDFGDLNHWLLQKISLGKDWWESGIGLKFGYIIRNSRDVYVVPQHRSTPNFITHEKTSGKLYYLKSTGNIHIDLSGKVVAIESADPGYDWLFSQNISGLITQFGGTNSHMAIRCREYNIPAAIGVGEALFSKVIQFNSVSIDAKSCILKEGELF
tara:strand:+ start:421 stop:2781 length:2361 start_codon:yes stop_codon:yes gene_type:complete